MDFYDKYKDEEERVKSFKGMSGVAYNKSYFMVKSGFYHLGANDTVRCYCCGIKLGCWNPTDNVDVEHIRHSPNCFFITQKLYSDKTTLIELILKLIQKQNEAEKTIISLRQFVTNSICGCDEVDSSSFVPKDPSLLQQNIRTKKRSKKAD